MDERQLHLMRPSPGTVDAGGSSECQSIFHCRGLPMLSLLYMSHRTLKLNVFAAPSPAHGTRCSFVLFLRKLPFQSHGGDMLYCTQGLHAETRCADIMPVYARPKPLLKSFDDTYARLCCVLLYFRAKEDVMRF